MGGLCRQGCWYQGLGERVVAAVGANCGMRRTNTLYALAIHEGCAPTRFTKGCETPAAAAIFPNALSNHVERDPQRTGNSNSAAASGTC